MDDSSRTSQKIFQERVRNALNDISRNPSDPSLVGHKNIKRFAMVQGLSLGIPLKNFVYSEYLQTTDNTRNFRETRYNDPEEMDANMLRHIAMRTKRVQPAATNTISDGVQSVRSDDSAKSFMNNIAKEITSPRNDVTFLHPESIKTDAHSFLIPAGDTDVSTYGSKRHPSGSQQPIDEAASFESLKISPRSHRHTGALHPTTNAEMTDNDTRNTINLNVANSINDRTVIPSEFGENISRASAHYGRQSMVSSPPKDLPTTPAINSFEQKTSSETFLALDRISTQLIDKNTPTADGEPRAPRDNVDAVAVAVKTSLPYFPAGNAPKNSGQELARERVECEQKKMGEKTSKNDREVSSVESVTSMPRRNDPLRAMKRVKRLTVSAAPTALRKNISKTNNTVQPEKDKNVKNTRKTEYRSKTAEKQPRNAKSLRSSSLEARIKADEEGSADTDAKNVTIKTIIVPVRPRVRFPPKVLAVKFAPHKKIRESTSNASVNSFERYLSGYFHDFYEARESLRTKIEQKVRCEQKKTRKRPILLYRGKNENVPLKNGTENYATAIKTFNVSEINISIDFKNSSILTSNLRDEIPMSVINTANVSEVNNSDNSDGNGTSVSNLISNLQNKILEPSTRIINASEINKSIDFNSSISNLKSNILTSDVKMFDASEVYNSINSDRNNTSASDFSIMSPQDKTLMSKKTRAYLNTSVSSQEATERSKQTEIISILGTTRKKFGRIVERSCTESR